MNVIRFEVGLVSKGTGLVTFLAEVFEMERLEAIESRVGTVHRLRLPAMALKVMVPHETPDVGEAQPFYGAIGLRYLTMMVDDLDAVVARAVERGAQLRQSAIEIRPEVRLAIFEDPDGNTYEVLEGAA